MGAPKIFAPEYYERMRALEDASWWNAGMRDLAERMLRRAGLESRGLLLDVGCGSGQTMSWFRRRWPGWATLGLDLSREGLRAARVAGNEQVLAGSALELPLPAGCAECCVPAACCSCGPMPSRSPMPRAMPNTVFTNTPGRNCVENSKGRGS